MSTYKYKDGNKQLIANHMEDVENASFRETMIKFHASSMVPALKAYLENGKNCPFPFDDEIIDVVALRWLHKRKYLLPLHPESRKLK